MKVLVACEFSGIVRDAFRRRGHDAWSCDLLECEADPKYHIQGDVLEILDDGWDLMIAHPPCTHLAVSGAAHFKKKRENGKQQDGINFFMQFVEIDCKRTAIENPVGIMSTVYRKPDQIIQPYEFGDSFSKKTCLWIKNLPKLKPTKLVDKGEFVEFEKEVKNKKKGFFELSIKKKSVMPKWYSDCFFDLTKEERQKNRSRTFFGIAEAMAEQWGNEEMLNGMKRGFCLL